MVIHIGFQSCAHDYPHWFSFLCTIYYCISKAPCITLGFLVESVFLLFLVFCVVCVCVCVCVFYIVLFVFVLCIVCTMLPVFLDFFCSFLFSRTLINGGTININGEKLSKRKNLPSGQHSGGPCPKSEIKL